jgi:lipoprotein-releasing system permease protein
LNLSLYIARRYLISKKSHNLINVISLISVIGQLVGTAALIIVLSVFNGFEDVIKSLYNTFNPDFVIQADKGKTFSATTFPSGKVLNLEGIKGLAYVVEEDALFKYRDQQYIAKIKGVSENYTEVSRLDTLIQSGDLILQEGNSDFAVVGAGVAWYLNINLDDIRNLLSIYVPRRGSASSFNFSNAFNNEVIHPTGIFTVQQEYDERYVFVPLRFARQLLDYEDEVTSVEVFLGSGTDPGDLESALTDLLGEEYTIKNRFRQNEALYKVMRSEKLAIFIILVFILILASFNMIGSLSILIVEKLQDIAILKSMGASKSLIRKIFTAEGLLISLAGSIGGLILGFLILLLQQQFGLVKLGPEEGAFIISAYPVKMLLSDFVYVFLIVLLIGLLATWYPVRYLTAKYASISFR